MNISDIILLIILAVFTILGGVRGLMATLLGLAVSLFAWIGSAIAAGALAGQFPWLAVFILCFIFIHAAGILLIRVADLAAKLPVIGALNALLGALLGFLRGSILLAVICSIGRTLGIISAEVMAQGGLLALFASLVGTQV